MSVDAVGIYRGICIDARDPQGLGRVRVQVPQVLGPYASGWAFPAWSMHDLTVWPEDRLPKPGQGVWVSFESHDRMVWLAAFGPQEFSYQPYDEELDESTGLPVAYETWLSWQLPVLPPDVSLPVAGMLLSISGLPQPDPVVTMAKHPPGAPPAADSALWETVATADVEPDGTWSVDYTRPSGEDDWWYRATYNDEPPFWPATAGPDQVPVPANPSEMSWTAGPDDFRWRYTNTVSGTLTSGGTAMRDYPVALYLQSQGVWSEVATARTDAYGQWTMQWFWPKEVIGEIVLRAMFLGDGGYNFAKTYDVTVPAVTVPVTVTLQGPVNPEFGGSGRFTGTVGTDDYGVQPELLVLRFQYRDNSTDPPGAWIDDPVQIVASPDGTWQRDHVFAMPDAEYRARFAGSGVYQEAVSNSAAYELALDTTVTAPTIGTLTGGTGFSTSGTVRDENGAAVSSGEARLMVRYASETEDDWRESAAPRSTISAGGQYSFNHPALDFFGDALWRVEYLGGGYLLAATSVAVAKTVGLGAVGPLTKGTVTNTSAAFSWSAVPAATLYEVYRNGVLAHGNVAATSYTHSSLGTMIDYTFEVRAKAVDVDGNTVYGAKSPGAKMNTGRKEIRKKGSFSNHELVPTATATYRPADGWGYNGTNVVQGYYSVSNRRGSGVITFSGSAFRSWVSSTYGSDVVANLNFTAASIAMYRIAGAGSGSAVSTWWYVTSSVAGSGGEPPIAGGVNSTALSPGASAWVPIPYPHWARHVLMNETVNYQGTNRTTNSFMIRRDNTSEYAKFGGKGYASNSCYLRVSCTWDFVIQTAISAKWY